MRSDPVFHLVPALQRLPLLLKKSLYCDLHGPAWSSPFFSSFIQGTLPCSPHSCHFAFLSDLLIILFLTMRNRLFSMSRMFFLPLFLWLISLHLLECGEMYLSQESFPDSPDQINYLYTQSFIISCTYPFLNTCPVFNFIFNCITT